MTRADLTTATVADLFPDADGQRFAVLLDQGRVGLVDTDLTGRLVRVNAAFAAMLGHTPAQLLGHWLPDQLLHPGDRTTGGDLLAPLLSGQVTVVDTSRSYTHADGSAVHTRITIAVLRDPDGRPAQLTTAVVDVTRQVQAQHDLEVVHAALLASQARTRAILDDTPDAFVGLAPDGTVSDWNPAAERLLGWTAQEAVGSDLAELIVPPTHRQAHRLEHTRLVASGVRNLLDGPVEMPVLHRDGRQLPVELVLSPQLTAGGWHTYAFLRDVRERQRGEARTRLLAQVVEASVDAICTTDLQGSITSWNSSAQQLYGWPAGAVLGTELDRLLPVGELDALAADVFRTGGAQQVRTR